jgi:hypothetical protein
LRFKTGLDEWDGGHSQQDLSTGWVVLIHGRFRSNIYLPSESG